MKVAIDCKNRDEATLIKSAMDDHLIRAFVLISGALKMLPTDRQRARVLAFVKDGLEDRPAEEAKP